MRPDTSARCLLSPSMKTRDRSASRERPATAFSRVCKRAESAARSPAGMLGGKYGCEGPRKMGRDPRSSIPLLRAVHASQMTTPIMPYLSALARTRPVNTPVITDAMDCRIQRHMLTRPCTTRPIVAPTEKEPLGPGGNAPSICGGSSSSSEIGPSPPSISMEFSTLLES